MSRRKLRIAPAIVSGSCVPVLSSGKHDTSVDTRFTLHRRSMEAFRDAFSHFGPDREDN